MKYLIVIDMQNDFITGSLANKEAQAIVPNVVKKIEDFDGKVFYTMDTHYPDGGKELAYSHTQEGRKLPIPHCLVNTKGWEIEEDVKVALSAQFAECFLKLTFGSTSLAEFLASEDPLIESIEICGICTDICVVSNAMLIKAFLPEIPIIVDASCCAGVTPEKHKAALETMKSCQIEVINE